MAAEDFTTYTEVDGNSTVTVTASEVQAVAMTSDETAYVYKDFGAGFFSGDYMFNIKLEVKESTSGHASNNWQLANVVSQYRPMLGNKDANHNLRYYHSGSNAQWIMSEMVQGGSNYTSSWTQTYANMLGTYYVKVVRDESIGTYGTLYMYFYSDAAMTTLVNTEQLALHENRDFRYLYALCSDDYNNAGYLTIDIGPFERILGNPRAFDHYSRRRRAG